MDTYQNLQDLISELDGLYKPFRENVQKALENEDVSAANRAARSSANIRNLLPDIKKGLRDYAGSLNQETD